MMEVFSLHREMTGEEGEQCRVRYSLTEDSCGPERCYGILCCCLLYTSDAADD